MTSYNIHYSLDFRIIPPCSDGSRHGGRYEYTALEAEGGGQERLELERKAKEEASSACSHYLKGSTRYTLIHHLKDIGLYLHLTW